MSFYDDLAEHYHLLFEDWDRSIERQAAVLNALLRGTLACWPLAVLDCACGIGTQALGFARAGHRVVASDLSPAAVHRARTEAQARGLNIAFAISDMTSLAEIGKDDFDVVAALDNALPHLTVPQVKAAVRAMASKLGSDGVLLASIRDYDELIREQPLIQQPMFYGGAAGRRIVHQVWDWSSNGQYTMHLYITARSQNGWDSHHFAAGYRCLLRAELTSVLEEAGLRSVRWVMPDESGYYQPIVIARRRSEGRAAD